MFQTLEHMADLETLFAQIRSILAPQGSVFVSFPNAEATDFQESTTGLWDMPPNHVGRWTRTALERFAVRHGFSVVETKLEPVRDLSHAWLLAMYALNARAYRRTSLEGQINALQSRALRGGLKRIVATRYLPGMLARRRSFLPLTRWAHLMVEQA
jgi:hypothetical protein